MSASATDILARVTIGTVARALGLTPRGNRIPAPWRETKDRNVSLNDTKGTWFDHRDGLGGGVLSFVMKARNCSKADALKFVADVAGVPLDDKPLSAADRAMWARERRVLERDLPAAHYWRRTAVLLCDERLVDLKAALFDPSADAPGPGEIAEWTREHARLSRLDGGALVEAYREAARREPRVTAGLVAWAKTREQIEIEALIEYLGLGGEVAA